MQKSKSPYSHSPAKIPPSPRLSRSTSGKSATSPPKVRPSTSRSCSNPKIRQHSKIKEKNKEKINPKISNFDSPLQGNKKMTNTDKVGRKFWSAPNSPSAWALSPGRSNIPFAHLVPKSPNISHVNTKIDLGTSGGGGRSGDRILNFFGIKKKMSKAQEEKFHRFRILQNRLLQWRFVNGQAEKSKRAVKTFAEMKLFNAWLRIYATRNLILEKRIQMQKLENEIKYYQIIVPQMCSLQEWAKLDYKITEAIGRLTRKLSSISIKLPLIGGAKGDVPFVCDALKDALGTMDSLQGMAINFLPQVEKICFLVTELALLQNQQEECMCELENWVSTIVSLQEEERCLRAHLLQSAN